MGKGNPKANRMQVVKAGAEEIVQDGENMRKREKGGADGSPRVGCDETREKELRSGTRAGCGRRGARRSEQPQLSAGNKGRGESKSGRRQLGPMSGFDAGPAPPVPRPSPPVPRPSPPSAGDPAQRPARPSKLAGAGRLLRGSSPKVSLPFCCSRERDLSAGSSSSTEKETGTPHKIHRKNQNLQPFAASPEAQEDRQVRCGFPGSCSSPAECLQPCPPPRRRESCAPRSMPLRECVRLSVGLCLSVPASV